MVCVGAVALYDRAGVRWSWLESAAPLVLIVGLFVLFLLAHRKQTAYITKRIKEANKT